MPHHTGVEVARTIRAWPDPPVVVMLTTFPNDEYLVAASTAGAAGYLLKSMPPEQNVASRRAVMTGQAVLAPHLINRLVHQAGDRMTPADPRLETLRQRARSACEDRARSDQ